MSAKQKSQSTSEYCLGWTWLLSSSERRLRSFGGVGGGGRSLGKELLATPGVLYWPGSVYFSKANYSQLSGQQFSWPVVKTNQRLGTGLGCPRIAREQIKETQETELLGNAPHTAQKCTFWIAKCEFKAHSKNND